MNSSQIEVLFMIVVAVLRMLSSNMRACLYIHVCTFICLDKLDQLQTQVDECAPSGASSSERAQQNA